MTTVAIIPARGKSKTLTRKNLRMLDGRPLIAHTIEAALAASLVDHVVVSTDDDGIARVAVSAGAEVPFRRPDQLATDTAPTVDVVIHAVEELERSSVAVKDVVTLQPTSPFRDGRMIDEAISLMHRTGADSAVSVALLALPVSVLGYLENTSFVTLAHFDDPRRQAVPPACRLTGGIYVTTRELLLSGRLVGDRPAALVISGDAVLDIDTRADLETARRRSRTRRVR